MRVDTVKTTVYRFDELSNEAKETAINNFREDNLDYEWYDFVYEDAIRIGEILGIQIDNIYFSGFWSQGDGACFEGYYEYRKGSVKALKEYAPKDQELHQIAFDLSNAQRKWFYKLSAKIKHSGHYVHEMCTHFDVYDDCGNWVGVDTENSIVEPLRDFMRWIYKTLEKEYDYLQSDEVISETLVDNEYEFTEDGKMY